MLPIGEMTAAVPQQKASSAVHGEVGTHPCLVDNVAEVASELNDRVTGDTGKNRTRQFRSVNHAIFDAEEVGSADFFDAGVRFSIKVNHFSITRQPLPLCWVSFQARSSRWP